MTPTQAQRLRVAAKAEALRASTFHIASGDGVTVVPFRQASERALWLARRDLLADADDNRYRADGRFPSPEEAERSAAMAEVLADELRERGYDDPDDPEIGRRPLRDGEGPFDAVAHIDPSMTFRPEEMSVLDSHGVLVPAEQATSYQLYWGRQGRLAAAEALPADGSQDQARRRYEREAEELAEVLDSRGFDNPDEPALAKQVVARGADDSEVALADATPAQLYWARQGRLAVVDELRWEGGPDEAEVTTARYLDEAREIEMEMRHRGIDPDDAHVAAPPARSGAGPFNGVLCSLCWTPLDGYQVGEVAGHDRIKQGEVAYTELAHGECAGSDRRFQWDIPEMSSS